MLKKVTRLFLISLFLFPSVFLREIDALTQKDVQAGVDEMLAYHVEYKELSPRLIKRSFKIFLEQFDPYGTYLLQKEAGPFWEMKTLMAKEAAALHLQGRYPFHERMESLFQEAIRRAREIRAGIRKKILHEGLPDRIPRVRDEGFSRTLHELQQRTEKLLLGLIWNQQQEEGLSELSKEDLVQILDLLEIRFARTEEPYLAQGSKEGFYLRLLKAFAKSLDAHTCFFSPKEAGELRTLLEKQFEGVGIVLREGIRGISIKKILEGGPAQKSGEIEEGDLLLAVDGRVTQGAVYEEVMDWLKGERGKPVFLLLQKRSGTKVLVRLVREKMLVHKELLQMASIPHEEGIIGVIDVPSFYESSSGPGCEDMKAALKALKGRGKLLGLVLDMRKNSGGFLSQAIKVAGVFIPSGVIVISKYAQGQMQYLREVKGNSFYDGPLVVLTSKMSASAAEIVAQALQDYGLALVVGDERTFGKGTIQYQTVTEENATSHFKVTVGRYYTVSGRSTQIEGVKTDIIVPSVCNPFHIGEKYLPYALKNDQVMPAYIDPLLDVDGHKKEWMQRHYLPTVQKRLSLWTEMLPALRENSIRRLQRDVDFQSFLLWAQEEASSLEQVDLQSDFLGQRDFQLKEAIEIVKEMSALQKLAKKK